MLTRFGLRGRADSEALQGWVGYKTETAGDLYGGGEGNRGKRSGLYIFKIQKPLFLEI